MSYRVQEVNGLWRHFDDDGGKQGIGEESALEFLKEVVLLSRNSGVSQFSAKRNMFRFASQTR
jgi:hypothetical protein